MIYSYKELQGKIRVGDIVRAVKGKYNSCNHLKDGGLNTQKITEVSEYSFYINGCVHSFAENAFLETVTPEQPTWETLKIGDVFVLNEGELERELIVLEVGASGKTFLVSRMSDAADYKTRAHAWWHIEEAQRGGWTPKDVLEPPCKMTIAEIEAKLGKRIEVVD